MFSLLHLIAATAFSYRLLMQQSVYWVYGSNFVCSELYFTRGHDINIVGQEDKRMRLDQVPASAWFIFVSVSWFDCRFKSMSEVALFATTLFRHIFTSRATRPGRASSSSMGRIRFPTSIWVVAAATKVMQRWLHAAFFILSFGLKPSLFSSVIITFARSLCIDCLIQLYGVLNYREYKYSERKFLSRSKVG